MNVATDMDENADPRCDKCGAEITTGAMAALAKGDIEGARAYKPFMAPSDQGSFEREIAKPNPRHLKRKAGR
jgi:hypothetical protein